MSATPHPGPFSGIWPALLSPLADDGRLDAPSFAAHAQALLEAGCGGLTPFGTTGEFASFSVAERRAGVEALLAAGVPAHRLMVSTSATALTDVEELTRHALAIGAHGCLMMPPFYFKGVGDAGVLAAYRQLIDRVADDRLRLYLYHIPQLSGVGVSGGVIATLKREYPQVILGVKDSQCERAHSVALAEAFMREVRIYVGNELDLPELGRRGSTGAISGVANFMPRTVHALVSQPDAADTPGRLARVDRLLSGLGGLSLIPALKAVQAALSGHAGWLRLRAPLLPLDGAQARSVALLAREIGLDPMRD